MKIFEYKNVLFVFLCIAAFLVFSGCAQTNQPDNSNNSTNVGVATSASEVVCRQQVAEARDKCMEALKDSEAIDLETAKAVCDEAYDKSIKICSEVTN